MIVDDLDIEGVTICKAKTSTPLIIDPYRMLADAVALQRFKSIGRWQSQILDTGCGIKLPQAHCGPSQNALRQPPRFPGDEKSLRFGISKQSGHFTQS